MDRLDTIGHRAAARFLVCVAAAGLTPLDVGHGQTNGPVGAGFEVQGYPAGLIVSGHGTYAVAPGSEVSIYAGYNWTDRGDFGEHDDEEGGGPGAGLGYMKRLGTSAGGWTAGARLDIWFFDIDWRDDAGSRRGTSEVTVLQPTARVGYRWWLAAGRLGLMAVAALGAEINVRTIGEEVGEGLILLGGIGVVYRF